MSSLSDIISDYACTSLSYSSIHSLIIVCDPPNTSIYTYPAFPQCKVLEKHRIKQCSYILLQSLSYAQHHESSRGNYNLLHILLMYFTNPLIPEYLLAPMVRRTCLEMLLYRLGGNKMASLKKRRRILENLSPVSHIVIGYRLSVTIIKCKIVEAKCTYCT